MPILKPDSFYEHMGNSMIKCGECWERDIDDTKAGKLQDDEAVLANQLAIQSNAEPQQCDDCLKQNEAYDDIEV